MKKSFSLGMIVCLLFASVEVVSAPAVKIIGVGIAGAAGQFDLAKSIYDITGPNVTPKELSGAECTNIAGKWYVSESITYTCVLAGEDSFPDSDSGSGTVDMLQNGCNVSYVPPTINAPRSGQITGNQINLSGAFVVPLDPGVTLSQNNATLTGTVNEEQFTINGTGHAVGTAYGIPFSCSGNSIAKFTAASSNSPSYPGISLNGSSLTIQLNAGDNIGKDADWWVVAQTPWGHWFSYVYPNRWNDIGTDLSRVSPAYQGPLTDISSLVLFDTTGIPSGNYVFYFGVDTNMNGVLDYSQLYYSSLPFKAPTISADYSGIYLGTFSGGDSGTFNATVSANGTITGTVYSNSDLTSYSASGQVSANGSLTMVAGSASTGATFNGNINLINGDVSGSWTNSYYRISGSFSGTKNK